MLYETECSAAKKQVTKMGITNMRILRWTCNKTRNDRIRNASIRDMEGGAPIELNLRE